MKRTTLLLLFFTSLIFNAHSGEPVDSVWEADPYFLLMGEADAAISERNWPEAAARLSDALAVRPSHPSNALLFSNLGAVYSYLDQDSLALQAYERGLEIAPNMLTLNMGRARSLLALGRDRSALDAFSKAIQIDSLCVDARFYHGLLELYSGNLDIAKKDFDVLESVAPKATDTAIALSTYYSLSGQSKKAIPYLETLIKTDPSPEYFANLAGCYLDCGELSDASRVIGDGMRMFPADPELFYYRAWLNRDLYRGDDARADAKKAISLGANPAKVNELFK